MRMQQFDERYYKLVAHWNPKSSISESYRTIRTNIQYASIDEKQVKTILVTSTGPGEGKSLTAANLSIVMAQLDEKTVYVDTDLRRPSGHRMFQLNNVKGVTSYLAGTFTMEAVIQSTNIPNLSVITSGPIPPNPAELLGSRRMNQFLGELKEQFDRIVFDSPPVIAVTDSTILATQVDGCILVVRAKKTKQELAIKAKQQLENVNARFLGVVLNNKKICNKNYYYY